MLSKLKKPNSDGFTIIEIMIVLAIAGLILLIVFLAVPALQRNARNTSRKNDVGSALSSVADYASNHNGTLPAASAQFSTAFAGSVPNFGYYTTAANEQWNHSTVARGAVPVPPAGTDSFTVYNYLKCNGTVATNANATTRSIVALYNIEGSSGAIAQCQES